MYIIGKLSVILPEEALDCPAGSGAMLAFLPILVLCESVLRRTIPGALPTEAVAGRGAAGREAGGPILLVPGLGGNRLAWSVAILLAACCIDKFMTYCEDLKSGTVHKLDSYVNRTVLMASKFIKNVQTATCNWGYYVSGTLDSTWRVFHLDSHL